MPSFISNFDRNSSRACAVLLLLLFVFFCLIVEVTSWYVYPRISRIRQRIEIERQGALSLTRDTQKASILILGNSLFESGIVVPLLQQELQSCEVKRFVLEDTVYLDWYYGLRHMFKEGMRTEVVVLGLNARQLLSKGINGDPACQVLYSPSDIIEIGRATNRDNTAISNLFFASFSSYFGSRTQIRKWVLTSLMPDLPTLSGRLRPRSGPLPPYPKIIAAATVRLKALKDLCEKNAARLIFVLPATSEPESSEFQQIQQAGKQAGVTVLVPIQPQQICGIYFSDGMHLNKEGAEKFTIALASELRSVMTK